MDMGAYMEHTKQTLSKICAHLWKTPQEPQEQVTQIERLEEDMEARLMAQVQVQMDEAFT